MRRWLERWRWFAYENLIARKYDNPIYETTFSSSCGARLKSNLPSDLSLQGYLAYKKTLP